MIRLIGTDQKFKIKNSKAISKKKKRGKRVKGMEMTRNICKETDSQDHHFKIYLNK